MTRPDLGPQDSLLPPLPDIRDDNIRIQVFTHRSFFARPVHIFEDHPNDLSPDNEKYGSDHAEISSILTVANADSSIWGIRSWGWW